MATSDLEVRIRDQYQGAGVGKLGDELERVNRNAGTAQRGMLPLVATIGDVMNIAGQAGRVFETAFDLAKEGAGIQRTNERLERMAATINSTADSITTRLQAATGGIVSNAELTASALQIISLGLAQNEDDVIRLGTVVAGLGLDMQQVILTFANNSIMRLDALGLSVDDVRARAAAFEAQGFDANKAFDAAVLAALEGRLQTLSGGIEDNAAIFQRFEAQIGNLTAAFKVFMAEGLTPVLAAMTGTNAEVFEGIIEGQRAAAQGLDDYIAMGQRLSGTYDMWGGLAAAITGTEGAAREALLSLAQDIARNSSSVAEFEAAFNEAFSNRAQNMLLQAGTYAATTAEQFYRQSRAVQETAGSMEQLNEQAARRRAINLATTQEREYEAAVQLSQAMYEQSGAFAAAQASAAGYHGISGEALQLMQRYPDIVREMTAAMAEQREVNRQLQAEFNAGITSYLQGADAADFYIEVLDQFGETIPSAEFETQKLRAALLEQSLAAGAGTFQIQQLMEATGQYSEEQIRAALNAAAMQEKIEALAGMIAEGTITVEDAIERLDDFAEALAQPFGIYIETGPLRGAISDLEKLIALYGTAAGMAGAIDAGEVGGGGSGSGSSAGTGGTTGGGDTFNQGGNTGMAAGGYVAAAQPYLVGERGPELFVPAQGGYVVNNSDLRGGGQDINIYIQDAGSLHLRGQIVDATGLLADQLGVRG